MGKYTKLFIAEARHYLETISRSMAATPEGAGGNPAESSRLSHSIKGMALFEEQTATAGLAYALERGFEAAARGAGGPTLPGHLTLGITLLERMIDDIDRHGTPRTDPMPAVEAIEKDLEG